MKHDEFKEGLPIRLAGQILLGKTYLCALCGEVIEGFRDRLSAKEFRITHTCQKCQDELFKPEGWTDGGKPIREEPEEGT